MPVPIAAAYFHEELMSGLEGPEQEYPKVTIVASHEGQVGRATHFQTALQTISGCDESKIELAVLSKSRMSPGSKKYEPKLVGTVAGRKCILIDDIVNTGTTLVNNIQILKQEGAECVYAWATHGVFGSEETTTISVPEKLQQLDNETANNSSINNYLQQPFFKYLLISNSVMNQRKLNNKIRLLNIAPLLTEAIARTIQCQSVSSILDLDYLFRNDRHRHHDNHYSTEPERYDNE
jgi:ribose-phosphate pyrophosphokinase